jgi:hypothetical protein
MANSIKYNPIEDPRVGKIIYIGWLGSRLYAKQNRLQINSFSICLFSLILVIPILIMHFRTNVYNSFNSISMSLSIFFLILEALWAFLTIKPRISATYPHDFIDKLIKKKRLSYFANEYWKMYYQKQKILKTTGYSLLQQNIILIFSAIYLIIAIDDLNLKIILAFAFANFIFYKLASSMIKIFMLRFYTDPNLKKISIIYVHNIIKFTLCKENETEN